MSKPITITDVKVILTQPAGSRLIVVKVITSEPGLYGLGCATFTQRWHAVAAALGLDTHEEAVTPAELDGTELWALSALHGIRIATSWVDGPSLAEQPGRLATWRARLDALRRPI